MTSYGYFPVTSLVRLVVLLAISALVANSDPALAQYNTVLPFSGRSWGVKESNVPVGPGGNRFSADPSDVWVDQAGLHLTISNNQGNWFSTEVVMSESLGYGTYSFQTNSRLDNLDANATFGAFTWDPFGDDPRQPDFPNREIDFEDSRWGNPLRTTNSQFVVQPYNVLGNVQPFTLPDLSSDPRLTRILKWNQGRVEFIALRGHHPPTDYPAEAIIQRFVYLEDISQNRLVPTPGRENFRFNLWLNRDMPLGSEPIEVIINKFAYLPSGDFDGNGRWEVADADVLVAEIAAGRDHPLFDQNGDGRVNQADLVVWLAEAGAVNLASGRPYLPGDANLDGQVDVLDFNSWNAHKFSVMPAWSAGDFNADGVVDTPDFNLWNSNKFRLSDGESAHVVPEPPASSWLLLSLVPFGRFWSRLRVPSSDDQDKIS